MTISIIIPNYNGKNLLQKNLPSVTAALDEYLKNKSDKAEIMIIDDNSGDDSIVFINAYLEKSKYPIKLLTNSKNMGFSTTVNKGVAASSGDIVILLNTDVSPEKEFLTPLLKHFSDEKVFAVGCLDKSIENGEIVPRGRGIGKWHHGFLMHRNGGLEKSNTLWASGGSSAFRKSLWEKLGGLYPIYNPFYWEDIDLSYRALKAGYSIVFEKESKVTHEHEKGAVRTGYSDREIKTIAFRNQFFFVWINVTDISLGFSHFFWLPVHILKAAIRQDTAFFSGFFQSLLKVGYVFSLRMKTQQLTKQSDKEIINNYIQ